MADASGSEPPSTAAPGPSRKPTPARSTTAAAGPAAAAWPRPPSAGKQGATSTQAAGGPAGAPSSGVALLHLSSLVGVPVTSPDGHHAGRLSDVIVRLGETSHPPFSGLVVKVD